MWEDSVYIKRGKKKKKKHESWWLKKGGGQQNTLVGKSLHYGIFRPRTSPTSQMGKRKRWGPTCGPRGAEKLLGRDGGERGWCSEPYCFFELDGKEK